MRLRVSHGVEPIASLCGNPAALGAVARSSEPSSSR